MVDYNTLKAFKLVVDLNSFSAAAKVLNVSQPAITNRIKSLERFLGAPLFVRKGKRFVLSPYGEILYKEVDSAIESFDRIRNVIIKLSKSSREKLRFATSTTVGNYFIPEIIQPFLAKEKVKVEMFIGNTEEVVHNLLSRYYTVGIVEGKVEEAELNVIPIKEDRIILVKSAGSNLPEEINLEDITNYPLVIREEGSGTRKLIEEVLSNFGITPNCLNILAEIGNTTGIINFVSKNKEVYAFVPEVAVKENTSVKPVKIKDISIKRKFSLITHKEACFNIVTKNFISYLLTFQDKTAFSDSIAKPPKLS